MKTFRNRGNEHLLPSGNAGTPQTSAHQHNRHFRAQSNVQSASFRFFLTPSPGLPSVQQQKRGTNERARPQIIGRNVPRRAPAAGSTNDLCGESACSLKKGDCASGTWLQTMITPRAPAHRGPLDAPVPLYLQQGHFGSWPPEAHGHPGVVMGKCAYAGFLSKASANLGLLISFSWGCSFWSDDV